MHRYSKKEKIEFTVDCWTKQFRTVYEWIFFPQKNTIVLYDSQLAESTNTELCIWRGNYEAWASEDLSRWAGPRIIPQASFKGQLYLKMLTAKADFEGKNGI